MICFRLSLCSDINVSQGSVVNRGCYGMPLADMPTATTATLQLVKQLLVQYYRQHGHTKGINGI